jgi:hypothetical protein
MLDAQTLFRNGNDNGSGIGSIKNGAHKRQKANTHARQQKHIRDHITKCICEVIKKVNLPRGFWPEKIRGG